MSRPRDDQGRVADEFANRHGSAHEIVAVWRHSGLERSLAMAKVLLDMAVSIDGFVGGSSGEDVGLYDWYFNPSEMSRPVIEELIETTGAIVLGRGAYGTGEDSGGWDDTPYAVPHFVITHRPPAPRSDPT